MRRSRPDPEGERRERVLYGDRLWSGLVLRNVIGAVCVRCKGPASDAMHVFPKGRFPQLRFDLQNGLPGCRRCHQHLDTHAELRYHTAMRVMGEERFEALRERAYAHTLSKYDVDAAIAALEDEHVRRFGWRPPRNPAPDPAA